MTRLVSRTRILSSVVALSLVGSFVGCSARPSATLERTDTAASVDPLKTLQDAYVANQDVPESRAYHFGSQGPGAEFSNHTSHTNRLIPVYVLGAAADLSAVTGANSIYRDAARLEALYGYLPERTLFDEAMYADQSDLYRVQQEAVARGAKHLFIVWFDGMDWETTRAAAIARTGEDYTDGKGHGLTFQDYDADGTAQHGYCVTSPTYDKMELDLNLQTVGPADGSLRGGYDFIFAGRTPWDLSQQPSTVPEYLLGQSGKRDERKRVTDAGGVVQAYTDSSTSAAEFISGRKSYNNGLNVSDSGEPIDTLFHQLQRDGWKLGTVSSVPFNHASPAAMYAHNVHRDDYQDIAREMLGLPSIAQAFHPEPHPGLDVVIGTGYGQEIADKARGDQGANEVPGKKYLTDEDLKSIDQAHGGKYVVAHTTAGASGRAILEAASAEAATGKHRLFGFFGSSAEALHHLPYRTANGDYQPSAHLDGQVEAYTDQEREEQPTLVDMTSAALTVLASDPAQPFALFVEAGDVDWALHANNLDCAIGAVYDGDEAVRTIIDWVEAHSNWQESVLIVTADHGHYLVLDDPSQLFPTD